MWIVTKVSGDQVPAGGTQGPEGPGPHDGPPDDEGDGAAWGVDGSAARKHARAEQWKYRCSLIAWPFPFTHIAINLEQRKRRRKNNNY